MLRRRPLPVVSRTAAALFGLVMAAAALPLVVPLLPSGGGLHEGDRAPRTLEAVHGAQYESSALTEAARQEAARGVEDVFLPPEPTIRQQQGEKLTKLLEQVRVIRLRTDLTAQQQLEELGNLALAASLSPTGRANVLLLDRATFEGFAVRVQRAFGEIMDRGVRQGDAQKAVRDYLTTPANQPEKATELTALTEVLNAFVVPNVQVDETATARRRDAARANVGPVVKTYSRGQVVIPEGEVISADAIEALRETGVIDDTFDYYDAAAGVLVAVAFGATLGWSTYQFQPFAPPSRRRMVLAGFSIGVVLLMVRIALPQLTPDTGNRYFVYAVPVAAAAMIASSFANLSFALVVATTVAFFAAFSGATAPDLAGAEYIGPLQSLEVATAYAAAGIAGAAIVARAERFSRFALASLVVALATWAVLSAFWLVSAPRSTEALGWLSLASALTGASSALITVGAFVLLSLALGIPTRFQLLELAQADHPLMRRLQEEAPGTFHHSMMVGTLAERAANNIGADALVAKVGAYYHDIGKLAQPRYYIENMLDNASSPHDALAPEASASIIRDHVANGLDIARRSRLPAIIRDFIPEHHGTRLVTFFYRRAAQSGAPADPALFRYTGPLPATKESAIVMLADSCEAVVRAGDDRSPSRIDEMVDGIFAERLAEGQFDECDITLRELQLVARTFKATLRAVYHPRIEYPTPGPDELAAIAGN
jgi:hypothetical protein